MAYITLPAAPPEWFEIQIKPEPPVEFHHEFVHDKIEAYERAIRAEGFDVPESGVRLADARVEKALDLVRAAREELRLAMRALREHKP